MAVRAPAHTGADTDHAGKKLDGQGGVAGNRVKLDLGGVLDVEVLDNELVIDPAEERLFLVAGFGNVLEEEGGEELR